MKDPEVLHQIFIGYPPDEGDEPPRETVAIRTQVTFRDDCRMSMVFSAPLDAGPEAIQENHALGLRMVDPEHFEDSRPLDMADLLKYFRIYHKEHRADVLRGESRGALMVLGDD